jgi:hypothetical protein
MRAAALAAVIGALALAGCGGGSSSSSNGSMLPLPANANNGNQAFSTSRNNASLTVTGLPGSTSASSTARATALSSKRGPQYLDTTSPNSAIVVSVSPQDPAEAAQYGTLTVCYNLYTAGVLNSTLTTNVGPPFTVTIPFPAPPGTDGFQVTQYVGQCSPSSPSLTIPTIPAGTANNGILSQSPLQYAAITAGANATTNNINTLIGACTQPVTTPPPAGFTCVGPGTGVGTIVATIAIAKVQFDPTVPITNPVREQGAFLLPALGTKTIGIPIPLEGVNAAGTVVPGLTTPTNLNGGAGPFPSGVTVTLAENLGGTTGNAAHAKLYLMDAKTGAIAQTGSGATQKITITEFNALAAADVIPANPLLVGDQWVLVMAYDGSGYLSGAGVISETVTATATAANAALPNPISLTISPQSAVWSAANATYTFGYADAAVPTAPVGLLQPVANGTIYMSDGASLKFDGVAGATPATTVSVPAATITKLTSIAAAQWPAPATPIVPNFIYGVDQGQASGTSMTEKASGVYAFSTASTATAPVPVAAQAGSGNWVQFSNPVGIAQGADSNGKYYLFVVDKTGAIYRLDIQNNGTADANGFQDASNVTPALITTGTALNPGTATYLGSATLASGKFLIADTGNNRIAQVDTTVSPVNITTYASGQPFTGFTATGTAGALYATTTSGQIYYISGSGATPVSLGFSASTTQVDGGIGQFTNQTPTSTPTLTPVKYPLQGQAASFFATTATPSTSGYSTPYTVAPFAAAGPVFTVVAAGIGLANDTSSGAPAANVGLGTVNATAGILIVPSTIAAPTATLTPGSILFTDTSNKLLRTIVQ